MLTADFDYELPGELIAQKPLPRGESRMMVLRSDDPPVHTHFAALPEYLNEGDLLVVNDTRVIPARLHARRPGTGGVVELLLVEKVEPTDWVCLAKPGRKARPGDELEISEDLTATILELFDDGRRLVRFSTPVEPHLADVGSIPLPPYIKRPVRDRDSSDYQTIFAAEPGAIAAPTAGLHFTEAMRHELGARGVAIRNLTLHVGIGTFKPVTAKLVHEHVMESERFDLPQTTVDTIRETRRRGGRVIAVGTTVVRTLESAALAGDVGRGGLDRGGFDRGVHGRTDLFIRPGFEFRVVDGLLTNFHLPRSTLLMLVSALMGRERILAAYREAVEHRYRFFSYGDATLLLPRRRDRAEELHSNGSVERSSP